MIAAAGFPIETGRSRGNIPLSVGNRSLRLLGVEKSGGALGMGGGGDRRNLLQHLKRS
jgi:hypothetical protein